MKLVNRLSVWGKGWKYREEREGKGLEPVDKHLGPSFHGTHCALDPDASSYWRQHWLALSPTPSSRFFHRFPKQRACSQATIYVGDISVYTFHYVFWLGSRRE